jgi:DNA (cytosine-5)-methyltransferase 1
LTFTFGTLCSGIEAASEAFLPLGATCAYVSEIEPYPCGVLADRHGAGKPMRMPRPEEAKDEDERRDRLAAIRAVDRFPRWGNRLPNYGDLTQIDPDELPPVDLLVAGFPCQDFSIAGLRLSLAGARGNLTLYGVMLIHELVRRRKLRSVLLEQVPDILNTKDNAFGALLGGLVGHDAPIASPLKGGRWTNAGVADGPAGTAAWRVEDAQYSHVAQRRERMFLVASFGDGPDPLEVLFERQGLSRNPPARRQAGEVAPVAAAAGAEGAGEPAGRQANGRPAAEVGVPFGCNYRPELGRPLVAPPRR